VAAYFVSDVHLRLDQPDQGRRFARLVDTLAPDDSLVIAGDLCDFWFASRQRRGDPRSCPGLAALASFRSRGGSLTIMPGNHDLWLGSLYEQALGARFVQEPLEVVAYGYRIHLVHGHLLGARSIWKAGMESRMFLHAFGWMPSRVADRLEACLDQSNDRRLARTEARYLEAYRRYAEGLAGRADLVVCGHIHRPRDEPGGRPRLVVLGGWLAGSSYLRVDEVGAAAVVEPRSNL
jgi:UDP-2,3-diacylglucosamine hydrolase